MARAYSSIGIIYVNIAEMVSTESAGAGGFDGVNVPSFAENQVDGFVNPIK